ncbi:MAG: 2-oxoacid:acceptor oxidoreductase subunit alpha [Candidatus Hodarchaeales archaeon]
MPNTVHYKDDISIVISGAAGQGIATVEELFTAILRLSGYNSYSTSEFMSRIRGGINSTLIRVSSARADAFIDRIDVLIPLHPDAMPHLQHRINENTTIISEQNNISPDNVKNRDNLIILPFTDLAKEIGSKIFSNIIAVGVLAALFNIPESYPTEYLKKRFSSKGDAIVDKNLQAIQKGYELGLNLCKSNKIKITVPTHENVKNNIFLSGTESIGLGALAGGCNFISSYPMSPSTGVLVFLSQKAKDFDVIVDQAEDEIAAINKGIAAWYAGARALITTSGGGFALMTEGLSLSGMIETPIVIHIAQRPGPATGLPTRTGQEDLQFVINAGHGEFARAVFAPGTPEEGFYLTQKAFNLADKYQVPVFVLTDQFFVDSHFSIPDLDLSNVQNNKYIVETDRSYKRYKLTDDGISPRGIPGYGTGLVNADSDEHDEEGHITEDVHFLRPKMVEKRLFKKLGLLTNESLEPVFSGSKDYETLVLGWGSTFSVIKEAVDSLERKDLAFLHFPQVYPLNKKVIDYLDKAKTTVVIENNATGQFARLIQTETGFKIDHNFLKYNGMPFSVEEVKNYLEKI